MGHRRPAGSAHRRTPRASGGRACGVRPRADRTAACGAARLDLATCRAVRRPVSIVLALAALAVAPALSEGAQGPLMFTLAGGDANGFAGDGKPASAALLNGPAGLDVRGDDSITVADTINQRIRVIDSTGRIRTI